MNSLYISIKSMSQILYDYASDSLNILQKSLELYNAGNLEFYRIVALQLRILLCDTAFRHDHVEDISILPKAFPDLKLHPINLDCLERNTGTKLPLVEWLEQGIPNANSHLTIRQFIRQICDQDGGAHADPKINSVFLSIPKYRTKIINLGTMIVNEIKDYNFPG